MVEKPSARVNRKSSGACRQDGLGDGVPHGLVGSAFRIRGEQVPGGDSRPGGRGIRVQVPDREGTEGSSSLVAPCVATSPGVVGARRRRGGLAGALGHGTPPEIDRVHHGVKGSRVHRLWRVPLLPGNLDGAVAVGAVGPLPGVLRDLRVQYQPRSTEAAAVSSRLRARPRRRRRAPQAWGLARCPGHGRHQRSTAFIMGSRDRGSTACGVSHSCLAILTGAVAVGSVGICLLASCAIQGNQPVARVRCMGASPLHGVDVVQLDILPGLKAGDSGINHPRWPKPTLMDVLHRKMPLPDSGDTDVAASNPLLHRKYTTVCYLETVNKD